MLTTAQIATVIGRCQASNAAAEVVLLSEIASTLPVGDPLRKRISDLVEDGEDWPQRYEQVLAEARRRLV